MALEVAPAPPATDEARQEISGTFRLAARESVRSFVALPTGANLLGFEKRRAIDQNLVDVLDDDPIALGILGKLAGGTRATRRRTVLAVFHVMESEIKWEIDEGGVLDDPTWCRQLVKEAWMERIHDPEMKYDENNGPNQSLDSTDIDEWSVKIEQLTDEILEDSDCEIIDDFSNVPPSIRRKVANELGTAEDHIQAAPAKLSPYMKNRLDGFCEHVYREAK
jgi:hypothetical protein